MKFIALLVALIGCTGQVHAAKACEALKSEVSAKLDGKGVKGYTLAVVAADKVGEAKIVGSCDRGAKKLIYKKK